jgi:hypothetical protein
VALNFSDLYGQWRITALRPDLCRGSIANYPGQYPGCGLFREVRARTRAATAKWMM